MVVSTPPRSSGSDRRVRPGLEAVRERRQPAEEVIEQVTGERYSPSQTWLILRQRLGWTRQRPARRAVERDEEAIEQWVKRDWPRIKRGLDAEGRGSASRTRADSRCCRS